MPSEHIAPPLLGALAGLATSALWTGTSVVFSEAGKRLSPTLVNTLRLLVATAIMAVAVPLTLGSFWPDLSSRQLLLLALSGVIGLAICDQLVIIALVLLGPRRTLLAQTSTPLFALLLGSVVLDERVAQLGLVGVLGIAMTVGGIAWVIAERAPAGAPGIDPNRTSRALVARGVALAILGSLLQAVGAMLYRLSDPGPGEQSIHPGHAAMVRLVFGLLGCLPIFVFRVLALARDRARGASLPQRSWRSGVGLACLGALLGPVLGMTSSLVAFRNAGLGIGQTLSSLSPVLILPVAALMLRERVSARAALGALVALAGASAIVLTSARPRTTAVDLLPAAPATGR